MSSGRQIVFVVGLYKSGTSLLTSIAENMGFRNLDDTWEDYVQGVDSIYLTHESKTVNALNDKIIEACAGSLDRLPNRMNYPLVKRSLTLSGKFNDSVKKIMLQYLEHDLVIKDPRFCITLPIWLSVIGKQAEVKIIWSFRERARLIQSWVKDPWCVSTLRLKDTGQALTLIEDYEYFLLEQYHLFAPRYKSFLYNLEEFKQTPALHVKLLADFLKRNVGVEEISKMVRCS